MSASILVALVSLLLVYDYVQSKKRWQEWAKSAPLLDRETHVFQRPPPPPSEGKLLLGSVLIGVAIAITVATLTYTPQDSS